MPLGSRQHLQLLQARPFLIRQSKQHPPEKKKPPGGRTATGLSWYDHFIGLVCSKEEPAWRRHRMAQGLGE